MLQYFYNYIGYSETNTDKSNNITDDNIKKTTNNVTDNDNNKINDTIVESKNDEFIYLITTEDLLKVNLKPSNKVIPNPSRNMPPFFDKINLRMLNKAQLHTILSVKLKPIPEIIKQKTYPYTSDKTTTCAELNVLLKY
jgi:hypothetical protein